MMDIVTKIGKVVRMETDELVSMHVWIHKDNAGVSVLARTILPQFTLQSKYYTIKDSLI